MFLLGVGPDADGDPDELHGGASNDGVGPDADGDPLVFRQSRIRYGGWSGRRRDPCSLPPRGERRSDIDAGSPAARPAPGSRQRSPPGRDPGRGAGKDSKERHERPVRPLARSADEGHEGRSAFPSGCARGTACPAGHGASLGSSGRGRVPPPFEGPPGSAGHDQVSDGFPGAGAAGSSPSGVRSPDSVASPEDPAVRGPGPVGVGTARPHRLPMHSRAVRARVGWPAHGAAVRPRRASGRRPRRWPGDIQLGQRRRTWRQRHQQGAVKVAAKRG